MTFFNKKIKKLFQKQKSLPSAPQNQWAQPEPIDKLEQNIQQGYEALRGNISTALLSHMRAELRYRIMYDQQKAYEDAPWARELSLWQRFRPAWQTGFAAVFLSLGLGLYFHFNPEATQNLTQDDGHHRSMHINHKSQIKLGQQMFGVHSDPNLVKTSEQAAKKKNKTKVYSQNNLRDIIEASLQRNSLQQARLRIWQKTQWQTASSFAPIPHQRTQHTRHKEDSGFFLFDYWKVNHRQKNSLMANESSQGISPTFVTYQD